MQERAQDGHLQGEGQSHRQLKLSVSHQEGHAGNHREAAKAIGVFEVADQVIAHIE